MYAAPSAAATAAPRRAGGLASGPVLAICCLLFILFLIAATIVLALIPVYLSTREGVFVGKSPEYTALMTPDGESPPAGTMDAASLSELSAASDTATGLRPGSFNFNSGVTADSGKRKRRGFGHARERRAIQGFCVIQFDLKKSPKCSKPSFVLSLPEFTVEVFISFTGNSGSRKKYKFKIKVIVKTSAPSGGSASATKRMTG